MQRGLRRQRLGGHDLAVRVLLVGLLLPGRQLQRLLRLSLELDLAAWLLKYRSVYVQAWVLRAERKRVRAVPRGLLLRERRPVVVPGQQPVRRRLF